MQMYGPLNIVEKKKQMKYRIFVLDRFSFSPFSTSVRNIYKLFRVVGFFTHSIYPAFIHIYAKISALR